MKSSSQLATRWYFLRGLGVVVCLAFVSLHVQLPGLIGSEGILPIGEAIAQAPYGSPWQGFFDQPSLVWFFNGDTALWLMSASGIVLSVALVLDVFPKLVLAVLWLLYLSLVVAGQKFLSYQWDILVVETLFASIFFAPGNVLPGGSREEPTTVSVLLMRLLFFKLMFLGGAAKLLSGDETWRSLTALHYHFETQPLATPLAWYADKLPGLLLKIGVAFTLFVELVVPFCVFLKRRARLVGVSLIVVFQVMVLLTGNYGIFNLLSILLALPVLGDDQLRWLCGRLRSRLPDLSGLGGRARLDPGWGQTVVVLVLIGFNVVVTLGAFNVKILPDFADPLHTKIQRMRLVNSYGLFASMTTVRREIIVQGSNDGKNWKNYELPYKPNDPESGPQFVAPHMPRLDWQMWFAVLRPPKQVNWFPYFLKRLLEGSDPVLDLLEKNPFPEGPPRFVRAVVYRYEFTGWSDNSERWWTRTNRRQYFPSLTLKEGKLKGVRFRRSD